MFYEAVAEDGRRSIGVAASPDGIRGWKRMDRYRCPAPLTVSVLVAMLSCQRQSMLMS